MEQKITKIHLVPTKLTKEHSNCLEQASNTAGVHRLQPCHIQNITQQQNHEANVLDPTNMQIRILVSKMATRWRPPHVSHYQPIYKPNHPCLNICYGITKMNHLCSVYFVYIICLITSVNHWYLSYYISIYFHRVFLVNQAYTLYNLKQKSYTLLKVLGYDLK